jgi:hypothetical protein
VLIEIKKVTLSIILLDEKNQHTYSTVQRLRADLITAPATIIGSSPSTPMTSGSSSVRARASFIHIHLATQELFSI